MQFDIRHEIKHQGNHYRLDIDGKFFGNYDTFSEAVLALEEEIDKRDSRDISGVAV